MTTPTNEQIADATTIWYKGQRVLRTFLTTLLTILPLIPQVIQIVQGQWDVAWLTPVALQAIALNSALTAIIALPKVNAFLTLIGFGSVPKKAIAVNHTTTGSVEAFVLPDPKTEQNYG